MDSFDFSRILKNGKSLVVKSIQPALPGEVPPCIEKLFRSTLSPVAGLVTFTSYGLIQVLATPQANKPPGQVPFFTKAAVLVVKLWSVHH